MLHELVFRGCSSSTRQFSESQPADSLRDKSNISGGWLRSLICALEGVHAMCSFRILKIVCSATVILAAVAGISAWVNYKIHRIPVPKREKLADCTSESLSFPIAVLCLHRERQWAGASESDRYLP